jgi:hypothetical protein
MTAGDQKDSGILDYLQLATRENTQGESNPNSLIMSTSLKIN